MTRPKCPRCDEDLLIIERHLTASEVDGPENDPADLIRSWRDETYTPHHWCHKCNVDYGMAIMEKGDIDVIKQLVRSLGECVSVLKVALNNDQHPVIQRAQALLARGDDHDQ